MMTILSGTSSAKMNIDSRHKNKITFREDFQNLEKTLKFQEDLILMRWKEDNPY